MSKRRFSLFWSWCGVLALVGASGAVYAEEVTVAAVQFRVHEEHYRSVARFEKQVALLVERAVARHDAEIVVFPEYINVFLVASFYPGIVESATTIEDAMGRIAARSGARADTGTLFRRHAAEIRSIAVPLWSRLADRYDVTIVAGTLFVPVSASGGATERTELRNRLFVFDEDGEIIYRQDKAYLTDFESDELGLSPGSPEAASPVVVDGLEIGITVCRDTYFDSWHERLGEVDLWIDLRANGEPYTVEVYTRFLRTLPERVRQTDAIGGINASLTGSFFDHVWAGPSYAVDASGRRIAASSAPVGAGIVTLQFASDADQWRLTGAAPPLR